MTKLKTDTVTTATANRRFNPEIGRDSWFADVELKRRIVSLLISDGSTDTTDNDAWDFDIENNLPVRIQVTGKGVCKILARLRNNKKYVRIGSA